MYSLVLHMINFVNTLCARKICVFCSCLYSILSLIHMDFPRDSMAKDNEAVCQWRRCGFDPWAWKIHCRRKWQSTPFNIRVFFSGKSHGQRSLVGLQSTGSQRVRHDLATEHHNIYICAYIYNIMFLILLFKALYPYWFFYAIISKRHINISHYN